MTIQTSLTGGSILTEKRRKKKTRRKKNEEKEKVKKSLLVEETNRTEQKIEIEGIGICSCYVYWPAFRKRELGQMKW